MASPSNNVTSAKPLAKEKESETSLSEYIYNQFETIVTHNSQPHAHPDQKIQVAKNYTDFIRQSDGETPYKDELFSPIISDTHLTIMKEPENVVTSEQMMNSGIQLPVIDWSSQFRKGYSVLMWVRFHRHDDSANTAASNNDEEHDPWAESMNPKPQILYRFATNASPTASGIQATLQSDSTSNSKNFITAFLRVESLRSQAASKADTSSSMHNTSFVTHLAIPVGKWTLIGVQHSFPYLKPPILTVAMDGVEVGKGEVSYPTLGNDNGIMKDNFILCNIPNDGENGSVSIEKVDFAGFGLYKENIPTLIQGIVAEHGPSTNADGVLPAVPPVVQNRDAAMTNIERISMYKKGSGSKGPFGLSSNRGKAGMISSRGIGIPLSIGVLLSSDGTHQGEVLLQRLLCKLVIGINVSKAVEVGGGRVIIPVNIGASVGMTGDVHKVGVVQPREPTTENPTASTPPRRKVTRRKNSSQADMLDENTTIAKCGGNIRIFNATNEFLCREKMIKSKVGTLPVPSYSLPNSILPQERPIPSFLDTYFTTDTFGIILQIFHLSLPPPGFAHKLQTKYYKESFDHLYDLIVYKEGQLAANLIELFAANLSLGGRAREEVLHSGAIHSMATLLRRVLLRASRLNMFSMKNSKERKTDLWKMYEGKETPEDELRDIHALNQSAPTFVPPLITNACCKLIDSCCGLPQAVGRRWKRPNLSLHIRRSSDIALTSIFGFSLEMDLFGNDLNACSLILKAVSERYCSDGFFNDQSSELVNKFDSGYGRLLRNEMSVQHLLDLIRIRFGEEIILSKDSDPGSFASKMSISTSLSHFLYMMLKYSLSSKKTLSQGEHDVKAAVNALSDCQLGSIAAHSILTAINDILVYCETFPVIKSNPDRSLNNGLVSVLHVNKNSGHKQRNSEANERLKKIKTDIWARLGRNLIVAEFHDVVAPLLISRTIFTGSLEGNSSLEMKESDLEKYNFHWQYHWRLVLRLFVWVVSLYGPEGEKAAKQAGGLLIQSGQAGSLNDCILTKDCAEILQLFLPPLQTPTSAVPSVSASTTMDLVKTHLSELSYRLRTMIFLSGGLVAGLLAMNKTETIHVKKIALDTISMIVMCLKNLTFYLLEKDIGLMSRQRPTGNRRNQASAVVDRLEVRTAVELVPQLVVILVTLEEKLQSYRDFQQTSDLDTWDLVDESSNGSTISIDEQKAILFSCQQDLLVLAATLITRCMMCGGGEASTSVWRTILSVCDTNSSDSSPAQNGSLNNREANIGKQTQLSSRAKTLVRKNVLCRLIALTLNVVVNREGDGSNPWTTIELCSSVARLCDLIEEKGLLEAISEVDETSTLRFTLDQIQLLQALLKILEAGRENTGWCQLDLPRPPSMQSPDKTIDKGKDDQAYIQTLQEHCENLIANLVENSKPSLENTNDLQMLAEKDEIYQMTASAKNVINFVVSKPIPATSIPDTISTSKMLLPILQPSLRVVLACLRHIRGTSILVHQPDSLDGVQETDSLLSVVVQELSSSLVAAVVGLAFSNARDVCLNTLSILRKSVKCKDSMEDMSASLIFRTLFLTIANEMKIRYDGERIKRETAKLKAYSKDDDPDLDSEQEAANANEVEALLIGSALTAKSSGDHQHSDSASVSNQSGVEDFIVFPDDMELERENKSFSSPRGSSTLGWTNYKGFGKSLEKCCQDEDGIVDVKDISDRAFHLLSRYLDAWDENQILDEEESELVELFDTKTSLDKYFDANRGNLVQSGDAADSMTSYIELASAESSRRDEIQTNIYPFKRYNNISFVEKQVWRKFMELKESSFRDMFERCMADGGRDYGARMVTIPTHPQFPRTIPKQLDHTIGINSFDGDDEQGFEQLNSLVQQGTLKIVDITKKENKSELEIEEDNDSLDGSNVLVSKPSANADLLEDFHDSEDGFLDFPSSEQPEKKQVGNDKSEVTSGQEIVAIKEHVKEEVQQEGISMDVELMDSDDLQHEFVMSTFANPPNISSTTLQGNVRHAHIPNTQINAGEALVEIEYENCVHIRPEGNRKGTLFVTPTHLFLEYSDASGLYEGEQMAIDELKKKLDCDDEDNEKLSNELEYERIIQHYKKEAAKRPKSIRWNIYEISHIYLRRYRLRDSAIEIFFMPTGGDIFGGPGLSSAMNSVLIDFGPGREGNEGRDDAANVIMTRAPTSTIKQWPEKSAQFLHEHLRNITIGWVKGRIGNFDYLLALNCLSGRSFNDLCQYPVFPWVLSNYRSEEVPNLNDKNNFRDLTKPMGALNPGRLQEFIERFETFDDPIIPPFMYGSHYSTSAGVVLHFLVRMHPFASLHRQLQSGHFDVADRLFSSVPRTWDMVTGQSASEVKELTPEWYCNPAFLRNSNQFKLGTSQDGETLGDVELPPWAKGSPERFVEVMRCALESEVCTSMLPHWIDLIFGRKQQGPDAVEAHNVFFYLTYYGSVDVASIEDEDLRIATELQIAHFGQCPMQLFWRPHVHKLVKSNPRRKLTLSEMLGVFDFGSIDPNNSHRQLPFESAPISHWVHLFAPPPGPHAPLISVRFVFPDRCIAIDALGIFHFFRWTWKADTEQSEERPRRNVDLFEDRGYFVATRELPHFRSVPRLSFERPRPKDWLTKKDIAVLAISRCLFSLRLLLVVSDGDGKGGITFQLVDPSKCTIQGEVQVRSAHSSKISAIHMDPIGTAAGVGGAAGEVAVIGSEDGTVTLWRFISTPSCNLPLRPRLKFGGHQGQKIRSVVVNTSLNLCASVSAFRCTIFNITNGTMLRSISPPNDNIEEVTGIQIGSGVNCETCFADSNSICVTSSGYLVLVCVSMFWSDSGDFKRDVVTLQLFTLEGRHLGAKALETWRGIPNKISQTYDGKAVMVCSGRGVSFHLISAIKPLAFIDEWQIGEDEEEDVVSAYDIDFGPSPSRPVVAATCLSSGALRLHALKGISDWSEDHKKGSVTEAVGNVIGTVKGTGSKVVGLVKGTGSRVFGLGREIGREAIGDVASKGAGFLGGLGLKMNPDR